ncbi:MAG: SDR family NAD(P)-dependent oxidoreductase [Myxococcota bacterium]
MSEVRFDGQVAVVTGAGGGLGREHAHLLAARGARVLVNDTGGHPDGSGKGSSKRAEAVVAEIEADGGVAAANAESVATPEGGRAIVEQALDLWGRVDVLVNNAGIAGGGPFHEIPPEEVEAMLRVHVLGAYNVGAAAWAAMLEQGYGRVVNTSSNSVFGMPGTSHYITAKAAIIGLTRALSMERAGHDLKVNAVMPMAYTRLTAQLPSKRFKGWLQDHYGPERVSPFVAFLASKQAPCSGELFTVGGGRVARVFLGVAPGYTAADPSPEVYRDHWEEIMSPSGYAIPADSEEEIALYSGEIRWRGGDSPDPSREH